MISTFGKLLAAPSDIIFGNGLYKIFENIKFSGKIPCVKFTTRILSQVKLNSRKKSQISLKEQIIDQKGPD